MTMFEPRPSSVYGSARDRANFTSARSSNGLCTTANRSAGPPTRIVVNRASGSSRDVLTPIRRWMSVPIAMASKARHRASGRLGRVVGHGRRPRAVASISAASGSDSPERDREHEVGDRVGGVRAGPARARRRTSPRAATDRRAARRPRPAGPRRSPRPRPGSRPRPRRTPRRCGAGARPRGDTGRSPSGARTRPPRRASRRRPGPPRGPRRRARPSCRRGGTGTGGTGRAGPRAGSRARRPRRRTPPRP